MNLWSTQELFEENAFVPAFDIWINQSVTSTPSHLVKYGLEAVEQGWTLRHVRFYPASVKGNLEYLVPEKERTIEHFFPMQITVALQGDVNDAGYFGFAQALVDDVYNWDSNTLKTDDVGTVYTVNSDYLDDATEPTASNLTNVDQSGDSVWGATTYDATDGKSIITYATEAATADNAEFYDVANATMLGFSMDPDPLKDVVTYFDTPTVAAMLSVDENGEEYTLDAGVLKRVRIWLHKRKLKRQAVSTDGGKMTTSNSIMTSISNAQANLQQIPVGTKNYFQKTIGAGFQTKKMGIFAVMNGVKKALVGYIAIIGILGLAAIVLLIIYRKQVGQAIKAAGGALKR